MVQRAVQSWRNLPRRWASADTFRARLPPREPGFARFVRPDGQGLHDVIDGPDGIDDRIRPNQIFAVSLPHSPLCRRSISVASSKPVDVTC